MIKVYGIKTCGSVRKALKFFKDNNIEIEFIDIRKNPLECETIHSFASYIDVDKLFNNKGTKYRQLELKNFNLDKNAKLEWLCKENMLLKRPIIQTSDTILCGVDEKLWSDLFQ